MDDNESFLELDISSFPSAMNPFASSTHLHPGKASQPMLATAASNGSVSSLSVNSVHDSALSDEGMGDSLALAGTNSFAAHSHEQHPPTTTEAAPPAETPKKMSDIMADLDIFMSNMSVRTRRPLPPIETVVPPRQQPRPTPAAPPPPAAPPVSTTKTTSSSSGLLGLFKKDAPPAAAPTTTPRTASATPAAPLRAPNSFSTTYPSSASYTAPRRSTLTKPEPAKPTPPPISQAPAFKPRPQPPAAPTTAPAPPSPTLPPPPPAVPSFKPASGAAAAPPSSVPAFKPSSASAAAGPNNILTRAATLAAADLSAIDRGYLSDTDADFPSRSSQSATDPSQRRARTTRRVRVKRSTKPEEEEDHSILGRLAFSSKSRRADDPSPPPEPEPEPEPEPAPLPPGSILALFQQHKLKYGHISPEEKAAADAAAAAAARRAASPDPTTRGGSRRGSRPGSRSLQEHEMRSLTLGMPPHWREGQQQTAAVLQDGSSSSRRLTPAGKGDSPRDFEDLLLHSGKGKGKGAPSSPDISASPDAPLAATMMESAPRYSSRPPRGGHDEDSPSPHRSGGPDPMASYQNSWRRYRNMTNYFYRVEPTRRSGTVMPQPVFYSTGGASPEPAPRSGGHHRGDRRGRSVSKGRPAPLSPSRRVGHHMPPVDSAASLHELRGRGGGSRSSTSGDEVTSSGAKHYNYGSRSHSGTLRA